MAFVEKTEAVVRMRTIRNYLTENIGYSDAKLLARGLGFTYEQIAAIDTNVLTIGFDFRQFTDIMLINWERKEGKQATVKKLVEALRKIERNDLAFDIQYRLPKPTSPLADTVQELRHKLKQLYANSIQLPRYPWFTKTLSLDEFLEEPETVEILQLDNGKKSRTIDFRNIFIPHENRKRPSRILIEGDRGYGKTILVLKILSYWSKSHLQEEQFRAAFMFQLRYFSEDTSIENALKERCLELGIDEQKAIDYIQDNQEEILFILDGFDEVKDMVKHSLTPLIKKETLPNVTVVVTCRRGWFADEKTGLPNISKVEAETWDKRILIKGLDEQQRTEFMEKYIKNYDPNVLKYLDKTVLTAFQCLPLLYLFVLLVDRETVTQTKTSKTSLFKLFLNSSFKNCLIRENKIDGSTAIDLFDRNPSETTRKYIHHFACFGKLSLEHLLQNRFLFEEKELLKCADGDEYILNIWLLTKCISVGKCERTDLYDPIHKTFLDFSAAFYLSLLSLHPPMQKEFRSWISQLVETRRGFEFESHIFPFLAGLMKGKASLLFELLKPQTVRYDIENSGTLRNILAEIEDEEDDVISYLVHLSLKWEQVILFNSMLS